jgi:MFS family permease
VERPRVDRNFVFLSVEAAFFSIAAVCFDAAIVLPVFIAQFTSAPLLIGAPAALRLAGLYLPQLPTALYIRRFKRIKGFLLWQAILGRAVLFACLPMALWASIIHPELVLAVVLVAFAVFAFTEGAATLAWLDFVGDVVHPRLRGRFFGGIGVLGGIGSIAAGFAVRELLGEDVAPPTFVPMFAVGCVCFMISALGIGLTHELPDLRRDQALDEPTLDHVTSLLRGGHVLRLTVAQVLAGSMQLALPFYVLFGQARLGLSTEWVGGFVVAQTVGASIAALGWARLAERYGPRVVVTISSAMLVVLPLLAMLAQHVGGGFTLLVTYALGGAAAGGSRVGFWQCTLDLVPARDRRVFMGLTNTANAPTLLMPVLGGLLLEWGGYDWLLTGSVIAGIAATFAGMQLADPQHAPNARRAPLMAGLDESV